LINEFDSARFTISPIEEPALSTEIYELRSPRHTPSAASERFIAMLEAQIRAAPALPAPPGAGGAKHRPTQ